MPACHHTNIISFQYVQRQSEENDKNTIETDN